MAAAFAKQQIALCAEKDVNSDHVVVVSAAIKIQGNSCVAHFLQKNLGKIHSSRFGYAEVR